MLNYCIFVYVGCMYIYVFMGVCMIICMYIEKWDLCGMFFFDNVYRVFY